MSKLALYSALAGTGSVGVVVVAVATGVIDLSTPDPAPEVEPAALAAPEVSAAPPQAAPVPDTGAAASLIADPAKVEAAEPVAVPDGRLAPSDTPDAETGAEPAEAPDPVAETAVPEPDPVQAEVTAPVEAEPEADASDPEEQLAGLPDAAPDAALLETAPAAAIASVPSSDPEPENAPEAVAIAAPAPVPDPIPQTAPDPKPAADPNAVAAPVAAVPPVAAELDAEAEPGEPAAVVPAPTFDIVRTETDGSTLIAGAAEPGSQLDVLLDGKAETSVTVGSDGRFVTFVDLPTEGAASVLTLRSETDKGQSLSEQEVIVTPAIPAAPAKQPEKDVALALAAPQDDPPPLAKNNDGAPVEVQLENAAPAVEAPQVAAIDPAAPVVPDPSQTEVSIAPLPEPAPQRAARQEPEAAQEPAKLMPPTILLSSARGVEVLQTAPLSPGEVALDSISYDDAGDVLLAGRGEEASSVRIYLDNTPITTSRIREDGRWRVELPQVDTGTYTLRVDQIDASGEVVARVESLFLRESAEVLARAAAPGGGIARSITVQPGHTLWEISTNRYGDGKDYVRVFEANRDRIGDPDLIYPGQIFDLPN